MNTLVYIRKKTNLLHDWLKNKLVGHIVHALLERDVDAVAAPAARPRLVHVPRAREEVPVLMEAHRHYTVSQVECFL